MNHYLITNLVQCCIRPKYRKYSSNVQLLFLYFSNIFWESRFYYFFYNRSTCEVLCRIKPCTNKKSTLLWTPVNPNLIILGLKHWYIGMEETVCYNLTPNVLPKPQH